MFILVFDIKTLEAKSTSSVRLLIGSTVPLFTAVAPTLSETRKSAAVLTGLALHPPPAKPAHGKRICHQAF